MEKLLPGPFCRPSDAFFFHEGRALFTGKGAPGHWAELVRLQLPFPGIKDSSFVCGGKIEEQSLAEDLRQ